MAEVNKADKASTPSQSPAVKDKDKEGLDQAVDAVGGGAKSEKEGAAGAAGGGGGEKAGSNRRGFRKRGGHGGGDGSSGSSSSGDPFVFRLLRKVAACMSLPVGVSGEYNDCVNRALTSSGIVKAAGRSDSPVSSHLCKHFLSITGIDVFVSGLNFFFPQVADRGLLLQTLLRSAPKYTEASQFCHVVSPYLVSETEHSKGEGKGKSKDHAKTGFYLLVFAEAMWGPVEGQPRLQRDPNPCFACTRSGVQHVAPLH